METARGRGNASGRHDPEPTADRALPLIITCAITGGHPPSAHSALPVTAESQAEAAGEAMAAGAAIVHVHGRDARDPGNPASDSARYQAIAETIRERVPEAILDFTQSVAPVASGEELAGSIHRYAALAIDARPEIMSLNTGPMTFRGDSGRPSSAIVTTFDDTARIAAALREAGIKPQVFLYHPGHLDILEHLIRCDLLKPPYWVQLVFGQQSGIAATPASVLFMVDRLPPGCLFQVCGVGRASFEVALLAMMTGGHVRTGMEDTLEYRPGEPVVDNVQLVARVARVAVDAARHITSPREARTLLGLRRAAG